MALRPYQQQVVDETWEWFRTTGKRRPLIVAPTGSGKSHIISEITRIVLDADLNQNVVILCHRKEILQQNAEKLIRAYPRIPIGVYSAGLNQRRITRCTMAGIQSVHKKGDLFRKTTCLIIDEAHLIPKSGHGMYLNFINTILRFNPELVIIGLTATPYRLGTGVLHDEDGLFDDISSQIKIPLLIEQGFLTPLVSKNSVIQGDLSNVKVRKGEYVIKDLIAAFDQESITKAAVDEMIELGKDRKSWLIFCTSIEHSQHVLDYVRSQGIIAEKVTGKTPASERADIFARYKRGEIRCLIGCDVFTTGFDDPTVDMIALLRATKSTSLYVQMLGRGMRIHPDKKDCLILDYAGNLELHGAIDQIEIKENKKTGKKEVGTAPSKTCPECREVIHASIMECACGYRFPESITPKHQRSASSASPLSSYENPVSTVGILSTDYLEHRNKKNIDKPPTLRVKYYLEGGTQVSQFLCFQHPKGNSAKLKADAWWREAKGQLPAPDSIQEALERQGELTAPFSLYLQKEAGKNFPKIISTVFLDIEASQQPEVPYEEMMF